MNVNMFNNTEREHIIGQKWQLKCGILHTGASGVYSQGHARYLNTGRSISCIKMPQVTECNAIFISAKNPTEYLLTWAFHAPPGSFGSEIDGDERGSVYASITTFINKVKEESAKYKVSVDIDVIFVGIQINSKRVDMLTEALKQLPKFNEVTPYTFAFPEYKAEMFDVTEFWSDTWEVACDSDFACIDIYFMTHIIVKNKKIIYVKGKGKNRGNNKTILFDKEGKIFL